MRVIPVDSGSPHPSQARPPYQPLPDDVSPLGSGEIHFLWWFLQGTITNAQTHHSLLAAWGMCARHAAGLLATEAAFGHGSVPTSALLYVDLMEEATAALTSAGSLAPPRLARTLRERGPCLMCDAGMHPRRRAASSGYAAADWDRRAFATFVSFARPVLDEFACPSCLSDGSGPLCRRHLCTALVGRDDVSLGDQRAGVGKLTRHLIRYARSFRWGNRDAETREDRAAMIAAVGWCSGWAPLLAWSLAPLGLAR